MEILLSILSYIRTNFFCNPRQSLISICVIVGFIYFRKMMKYDNSNPAISVKYIACTVLSFSVLMLVY